MFITLSFKKEISVFFYLRNQGCLFKASSVEFEDFFFIIDSRWKEIGF